MSLYDDPENKFIAGFKDSPEMNFLDGIVATNHIVVMKLSYCSIETSIKLQVDSSKVTNWLLLKALSLDMSKTDLKIDIYERLGSLS